MQPGRLTVKLFASVISIVMVTLLSCTDPLNPNNATDPGYSPTSFDLFLGDSQVAPGDTLHNGLTTESDIRLTFETIRAFRIEEVHVSFDSERGDQGYIRIKTDTLKNEWLDGTQYSLSSFGYDKGGVYTVTVTVLMNNNQADIINTFYLDVQYIPTTVRFFIDETAIENIDTTADTYTTESFPRLDFEGTIVNRIDTIIIDRDTESGEDEPILITDSLTGWQNDNTRYTLSSWQYARPGIYRFSVTARMNNHQPDIVTAGNIRIAGHSAYISEHPRDTTVTEGGDALFSLQAGGTTPLTYRWCMVTHDADSAYRYQTVAQSESLRIANVSLADTGLYTCIVTNEFGVDTTDLVSLTVKVLPPDSGAPVISFAFDTANGIEGARGNLPLRLSKAHEREVSVEVEILSLSTADSADYLADSLSVVFAPGQTERLFSFATIGDHIAEPDETIVFRLRNAMRAFIDSTAHTCTYTIIDDDTDREGLWPKISFARSADSGPEGRVARVDMLLSKDTTYAVTAHLVMTAASRADASDIIPANGDTIVTFAPAETRKTIYFTVFDDNVREEDETAQFEIVIPRGQKVSAGDTSLFTYEIIDNDTTFVRFPFSSGSVVESDTTLRIPIVLSARNTQPVTVRYTVLDCLSTAEGGGVDYETAGDHITVAPFTDTAYIPLSIVNDTIPEPDETVPISITGVEGGGAKVSASGGQYTLRIRDDENITVGFATDQTVATEGSDSTVTIRMNLTGAVRESVVVIYEIDGGDAQGTDADYEIVGSTPRRVIFAPEQTGADIKIRVVDDNKDEDEEYFDFKIIDVTGANVDTAMITTHRVIIIDDDIPYFAFATGSSDAPENDQVHRIPVTLSTPSVFDIMVGCEVSGGSAAEEDYFLAGSDTLFFAAGDTTRYIDVKVFSNLVHNDTRTVEFTLVALDTLAHPGTSAVRHTLTIMDRTIAVAVGANDTTMGSTDPSGLTTVNHNDYIQLNAEAKAHHHFVRWEAGGGLSEENIGNPASPRTTLDSIRADGAVTAVFARDTYTVTLSTEDTAKGAVSFTQRDVYHGDTLLLTATAKNGHHFRKWTVTEGTFSLDDSTSNRTVIRDIDGSGTITAEFAIDTFTIRVNSSAGGTTSPATPVRVTYGGDIPNIRVNTVEPGYRFDTWVLSNTAIAGISPGDTAHTITLTNVTGNDTLTAHFVKKQYSLTVPAVTGARMEITPAPLPTGKYEHGTEITITAELEPGWEFDGWTNVAGTSEGASFVIIHDTTVALNISPIAVPAHVMCVNLSAQQNGGGELGTNWVDAYHDIHSAVGALSAERNTIWVAQGDYEITTPVELPANSSLIGGFVGDEVDSLVFNPTRVTRLVGNNTDAIMHVPQGADNVYLSTLYIEGAGGNAMISPFGGVYAAGSRNLFMHHCVIRDNEPKGIVTGVRTFIDACVIMKNTSELSNSARGAGIMVTSDSVYIINSVICDNRTHGTGAAIWASNDSNIVIINSTIVNNHSMDSSSTATGGVCRAFDAYFVIANSIIWGNTTLGETIEGTQINFTDFVSHTNIQDHSGDGIGWKKSGWEVGNLDESPSFLNQTDPIGEDSKFFTDDDGLMLKNGSRCIDEGGNISGHNEWKPEHDIRGVDRADYWPWDMGAYEYSTEGTEND